MTPSDSIKVMIAAAFRAGSAVTILAFGLAALLVLDAANPAQARSLRPRERHKEVKKEIKKETKIPSGPLLITVTIGTQRVALYANGELLTRSAVSTGTRSHPTPTGVFSIIQKNKWHRSNIYSNAPMPYMQRITWSGVALHEGSLPGYPASHGCIRLTGDFARLLWSTTKIGARVLVTHDEVTPIEFAHPRLFTPKDEPDNPPLVAAATDATASKDPSAEDLMAAAEASLRMAALQANEEMLSTIENARIKTARRKGPISIFISRKTKKLYARQALEPLFEMPVTITGPDQPIGTHVFTAMEVIDNGTAMRWTAVSMPAERPKSEPRRRTERDYSSRRKQADMPAPRPAPAPLPTLTAAEVLDRIDIPKEARDRIGYLLMPGASLVVSDHGLGDETGEGTDFIVVTRS